MSIKSELIEYLYTYHLSKEDAILLEPEYYEESSIHFKISKHVNINNIIEKLNNIKFQDRILEASVEKINGLGIILTIYFNDITHYQVLKEKLEKDLAKVINRINQLT